MGRDLQSLLTRLLILGNGIVASFGALVCLALWADPERFAPREAPVAHETVWAQLGAGPVKSAALLGVIVLTANVLWLLYGRTPRQPLQFIVSETGAGPLKIAREAIVAGLQRAGEELDDVSRVRVQVESAALRKIMVAASFQCPEGVPVQDAGQRLRSTLAGAFFELVRLGDDRRLEVSIEFTGRSGRLAKRKEDPAPAEESAADESDAKPFRGPEYPIGDDEPYRG